MRRFIDFHKGLKVMGHPAHAMVVHFPIAFLSVVFPLELMGVAGWEAAWLLAFWSQVAGVVACLPAAATGLADIVALAGKPAAADTASRHMSVMLGAALLFGLGLFLKGGAGPVEGIMAIAILGLSLSGTMLLLWGGWLGGELVHRHGATQD